MSAATDRLLTKYNGRIYNPDTNAGGLDGPGGMEANYLDVAADVATVGVEVAGNSQSVAALRDAVAADRTAVGNDRTAVAADRTTVQTLLTQAQSVQAASAASAVLAQQYIGTATNVIIPAINYRLASAWDANGNATQYALTGAVSQFVYDTRKDWDRGAWRKGKLARSSSWYNEPLNTSTRGAKREFPVVALVIMTTTQLIIYDQNDLDANGSPRMWMVFTRAGGSWTSWTANTLNVLSLGTAPISAKMLSGNLIIGFSGGALAEVFFPTDSIRCRTVAERKNYGGRIADRNATKGYTQDNTALGYIVNSDVTAVDLRILPGAPLDPVSRLPIPTIAVATAGGLSVIHPTGLIANITGMLPDRVAFVDNGRIWARQGAWLWVGPVPFSTIAASSWRTARYAGLAADALGGGLLVNSANLGGTAMVPGAVGSSNMLTLLAEDAANPATGMVSYVTKDYATPWQIGNTRLCLAGGSLTDRSAVAAVVAGTATYAAVNGGDLQATTATSAITAPVTTGGVCYGWLYTAGAWKFCKTISDWGGAVTEAAGTLNIASGTVFTRLVYTTTLPTVVQLAKVEADDRPLFAAGAKAFLGGTSNAVQALAWDDDTGVLTVGTADGVDQFAGLRRVGRVAANTQGIGPELVTNGDGSNTAGWTQSSIGFASVGGEFEITATGTANESVVRDIAVTVGKAYVLCADGYKLGSTNYRIDVTPTNYSTSFLILQGSSATKAPLSGVFIPTTSTARLTLRFDVTTATAGQKARFDNISVKEVGALSTGSVTLVAAGGGAVLVGTANEAGVVSELMPIKDYLLQSGTSSDTDAASTSLAAFHAAMFSF